MTRSTHLSMILGAMLGGSALAQAATPDATAPEAQAANDAATSSGIVPIRDYSGGLRERSHLLGSLDGTRDSLAGQGVQFHVDWTQHLQSVVDGGRDTGTEYGGSLDYVLSLDLDRMGMLPGALITMRGESRYGDSVNRDARLLLPANTDLGFPLSSDEDLAFALTELTYTQYLSSTFGLFVGKLNTFGGDPNEFAHGRGKHQFGNSDFVFNPVTAVTVPYSTLGVGAVWAPTPMLVVFATIMNTADSSTTTGFDDFGDGWTLSVEAQTQYTIGSQPGGQNIGFTYAADGSFADLTGRVSLGPGVGLTPPETDESHAIYWSGWQYLWSQGEDDGVIDTRNGTPDRPGFGLFARAGYGDEDTSLVQWHVSGGIGGRGLFAGRENDHYGVGYSYSDVNLSRITSVVLNAIPFKGAAQGVEAFYNAELTPATHLTFSMQAYDDVNARTDTALLLGLRLNIRF